MRGTITRKGSRPTNLDDELIEEICGYLDKGATDVCVCRIIGVAPTVFHGWKRKGQDESTHEIYHKFYEEYEKHKGYRELAWLEKVGDPKWMLTHHPDTKNAFAEIRYQKDEYSGTLTKLEAAERKKAIQEDIVNGFTTISDQLETSRDIEEEIPRESDEPE